LVWQISGKLLQKQAAGDVGKQHERHITVACLDLYRGIYLTGRLARLS
jgi:hypothetical protein